MKLSTFIQVVILMLLIAFAASCGTSHPTSRYPDGRDYPDRYPHDDRSVHRLPPGHAKKVYGNKSARSHAPGHRKSVYRYPIIITMRPGMNIRRSSNGRYYYRNPAGFYYWQGYDNRLYLDDRHMSQVQFDQYTYDEWRSQGRNNASRHRSRRY
jgi:hypothetical protein